MVLLSFAAAFAFAKLTAATLPTVTLDEGIFTGHTTGRLNQFLGIPFAKPP